MKEKSFARERVMWTAAVAVLASSLAWLGLINLGLLFGPRIDRLAAVLVVLKVVLRAMVTVITTSWPLALAALAAAGLVVIVAHGAGSRAEKRVRHA